MLKTALYEGAVRERMFRSDIDYFEALLRDGKVFNYIELHFAIKSRDLEMIALVSENLDSKFKNVRHAGNIISTGDIEIVEYFRKDIEDTERIFLGFIANTGSYEFLTYISGFSGVEINSSFYDLSEALKCDDIEKFKFVHDYYPHVDVRDPEFVKRVKRFGNTEMWNYLYGE